jgi:hypothetical protein
MPRALSTSTLTWISAPCCSRRATPLPPPASMGPRSPHVASSRRRPHVGRQLLCRFYWVQGDRGVCEDPHPQGTGCCSYDSVVCPCSTTLHKSPHPLLSLSTSLTSTYKSETLFCNFRRYLAAQAAPPVQRTGCRLRLPMRHKGAGLVGVDSIAAAAFARPPPPP